MDKVLYNIEGFIFRKIDGILYLKIDGWCLFDECDTYALVLINSEGKALSCNTERKKRYDVTEEYERYFTAEQSEGAGFSVFCKCTADELGDGIRLLAIQDDESEELFSCKKERVLELAEKDSLIYSLDLKDISGDTITLSGWTMTLLGGDVDFEIQDARGNLISADVMKTFRPDVEKTYFKIVEISDYKTGFFVKFKDIKSNKYKLIFRSEDEESSVTVSRRDIIKETKRRNRKFTFNEAVKEEFKGGHIGPDLRLLMEGGLRDMKNEWYIRYVGGIDSYDTWYRDAKPKKPELEAQAAVKFEYSPKISIIVPAYHTPKKFLKQMVRSVQAQSYSNWELCIADGGADDAVVEKIMRTYVKKDSRIKYKKLERNEGIAGNTNKALELATGEFYALLDHDDILTPDALYEIVSALNENPGADVVYTDEDKVTMDLRMYFDPNFKSDFNREMLRCCNYICHLFAVNRSVVDKAGTFNDRYEGSQDFDFILRCTENADLIIHVPKILYHWRSHPASTAADPTTKLYCYESGVRAIDDHLKRQGINGCASMLPGCYGYYHVDYGFDETDLPFISIVIIDKGNADLLQACVDSVLVKTAYPEYEILIIKSRSASDSSIADTAAFEKDEHINTLTWEGGYERSSMINFGAEHAKGEYLLFLDSDTEVITEGWLKILITDMKRNNTGAAGAKLLYPDETIEHAGIVVGRDGVIGYPFAGHDRNDTNFGCRALLQQNVNAVSATCMIVSKRVFEMVDGFDRSLKAVYDDVDFCLKVREAGSDIIYEPTVELYHNVPKSGYKQYNAKKKRRAEQEYEYVRNKWADAPECGQYYSKELIDIMCSARYFRTEMGVKDK